MQQQAASTSTAPRAEIELQSGMQSSHPFRVATFNILADGLAQSGDFVKVPISCLLWEHRLPLILQEIRAADADIICLQELNHFDTLASVLVPEGFSCFFRAKKPSPALKFGFPADGIALFYRHTRFSCSPAPSGHCFASIDGQPAAQGFVTAQLHDKQSGRSLIVVATHLKAKADNEQTRVHQACQLLQEVDNMQERHYQLQLQQGSAAARPAAVLVCGDFNTTPDSETVQIVKQHALGLASIWDVPWSARGSSAAVPASSNGNGKSHGNGHGGNGNGNGNEKSSSSSSSAALAAPNGNGTGHGRPASPRPPADAAGGGRCQQDPEQAQQRLEQQQWRQQQDEQLEQRQQGAPVPAPAREGMEFTTWKFRSSGVAKRTIDYIWFSRQQLAPTSRWRMLSEAEIGPQGLPNQHYPSDHMCVVAQFGWIGD